jgi:nitroreductase
MMQDVLKLVQGRRSSRGLFDPKRPVSRRDLRKILEAGRWSPSAHNMQNFEVVVVDDRKLLKDIGDIRAPISETFIRENYKQLSFSVKELLRKKVGILGTMFPAYMRTPGAKPPPEERMRTLGKVVQTSPVLLVVLYDPRRRAPASEGDFLGIISLGCMIENIWLTAHSLGLGVHIVSSIGAGRMEKKVKSLLHIPGHLKIAFTVRLGYPLPAPARTPRVRRDLEDFVHRNRFGKRGMDGKTGR